MRRVALYQQVVERLTELITSGQLRPGDRLPNEGDLASQFGVSRTVIREAVRTLRERGVLEVSPGRGTVVTRPSPAFLVEAMSSLFSEFGDVTVDNFLEVRALLEQRVARLAAERATREDIERIAESLEHSRTDSNPFRANFAFHIALADATHNPLFATLLQVLTERTGQISQAVYDQVPEVCDRVLSIHSEILEHVRNHNPVAAEDAAQRHMIMTQDNYLRVLGENRLRAVAARDAKAT